MPLFLYLWANGHYKQIAEVDGKKVFPHEKRFLLGKVGLPSDEEYLFETLSSSFNFLVIRKTPSGHIYEKSAEELARIILQAVDNGEIERAMDILSLVGSNSHILERSIEELVRTTLWAVHRGELDKVKDILSLLENDKDAYYEILWRIVGDSRISNYESVIETLDQLIPEKMKQLFLWAVVKGLIHRNASIERIIQIVEQFVDPWRFRLWDYRDDDDLLSNRERLMPVVREFFRRLIINGYYEYPLRFADSFNLFHLWPCLCYYYFDILLSTLSGMVSSKRMTAGEVVSLAFKFLDSGYLHSVLSACMDVNSDTVFKELKGIVSFKEASDFIEQNLVNNLSYEPLRKMIKRRMEGLRKILYPGELSAKDADRVFLKVVVYPLFSSCNRFFDDMLIQFWRIELKPILKSGGEEDLKTMLSKRGIPEGALEHLVESLLNRGASEDVQLLLKFGREFSVSDIYDPQQELLYEAYDSHISTLVERNGKKVLLWGRQLYEGGSLPTRIAKYLRFIYVNSERSQVSLLSEKRSYSMCHGKYVAFIPERCFWSQPWWECWERGKKDNLYVVDVLTGSEVPGSYDNPPNACLTETSVGFCNDRNFVLSTSNGRILLDVKSDKYIEVYPAGDLIAVRMGTKIQFFSAQGVHLFDYVIHSKKFSVAALNDIIIVGELTKGDINSEGLREEDFCELITAFSQRGLMWKKCYQIPSDMTEISKIKYKIIPSETMFASLFQQSSMDTWHLRIYSHSGKVFLNDYREVYDKNSQEYDTCFIWKNTISLYETEIGPVLCYLVNEETMYDFPYSIGCEYLECHLLPSGKPLLFAGVSGWVTYSLSSITSYLKEYHVTQEGISIGDTYRYRWKEIMEKIEKHGSPIVVDLDESDVSDDMMDSTTLEEFILKNEVLTLDDLTKDTAKREVNIIRATMEFVKKDPSVVFLSVMIHFPEGGKNIHFDLSSLKKDFEIYYFGWKVIEGIWEPYYKEIPRNSILDTALVLKPKGEGYSRDTYTIWVKYSGESKKVTFNIKGV